jgi:hypothetical protein
MNRNGEGGVQKGAGARVGLSSRPPEHFDRVYSPPEPPAPARRSRLVTVLLAVVGFAVAATAVFVLMPRDRSGRTVAAPVQEPSSAQAQASPSQRQPPPASPAPSSPSPSPTPSEAVYTALPAPCGTVSAATVQRLVPDARRTQSSNRTFGSCSYSSEPDAGFRWLQVESRLYSPANTATPVQDAQRLFGVQWTLAGKATEERTVLLERQGGLGDQAYRWFKVDERQPTVIGVVAVRQRNVVITVSYSEQTAGKSGQRAQEQRCLSQAATVAREVLAELS